MFAADHDEEYIPLLLSANQRQILLETVTQFCESWMEEHYSNPEGKGGTVQSPTTALSSVFSARPSTNNHLQFNPIVPPRGNNNTNMSSFNHSGGGGYVRKHHGEGGIGGNSRSTTTISAAPSPLMLGVDQLPSLRQALLVAFTKHLFGQKNPNEDQQLEEAEDEVDRGMNNTTNARDDADTIFLCEEGKEEDCCEKAMVLENVERIVEELMLSCHYFEQNPFVVDENNEEKNAGIFTGEMYSLPSYSEVATGVCFREREEKNPSAQAKDNFTVKGGIHTVEQLTAEKQRQAECKKKKPVEILALQDWLFCMNPKNFVTTAGKNKNINNKEKERSASASSLTSSDNTLLQLQSEEIVISHLCQRFTKIQVERCASWLLELIFEHDELDSISWIPLFAHHAEDECLPRQVIKEVIFFFHLYFGCARRVDKNTVLLPLLRLSNIKAFRIGGEVGLRPPIPLLQDAWAGVVIDTKRIFQLLTLEEITLLQKFLQRASQHLFLQQHEVHQENARERCRQERFYQEYWEQVGRLKDQHQLEATIQETKAKPLTMWQSLRLISILRAEQELIVSPPASNLDSMEALRSRFGLRSPQFVTLRHLIALTFPNMLVEKQEEVVRHIAHSTILMSTPTSILHSSPSPCQGEDATMEKLSTLATRLATWSRNLKYLLLGSQYPADGLSMERQQASSSFPVKDNDTGNSQLHRANNNNYQPPSRFAVVEEKGKGTSPIVVSVVALTPKRPSTITRKEKGREGGSSASSCHYQQDSHAVLWKCVRDFTRLFPKLDSARRFAEILKAEMWQMEEGSASGMMEKNRQQQPGNAEKGKEEKAAAQRTTTDSSQSRLLSNNIEGAQLSQILRGVLRKTFSAHAPTLFMAQLEYILLSAVSACVQLVLRQAEVEKRRNWYSNSVSLSLSENERRNEKLGKQEDTITSSSSELVRNALRTFLIFVNRRIRFQTLHTSTTQGAVVEEEEEVLPFFVDQYTSMHQLLFSSVLRSVSNTQLHSILSVAMAMGRHQEETSTAAPRHQLELEGKESEKEKRAMGLVDGPGFQHMRHNPHHRDDLSQITTHELTNYLRQCVHSVAMTTATAEEKNGMEGTHRISSPSFSSCILREEVLQELTWVLTSVSPSSSSFTRNNNIHNGKQDIIMKYNVWSAIKFLLLATMDLEEAEAFEKEKAAKRILTKKQQQQQAEESKERDIVQTPTSAELMQWVKDHANAQRTDVSRREPEYRLRQTAERAKWLDILWGHGEEEILLSSGTAGVTRARQKYSSLGPHCTTLFKRDFFFEGESQEVEDGPAIIIPPQHKVLDSCSSSVKKLTWWEKKTGRCHDHDAMTNNDLLHGNGIRAADEEKERDEVVGTCISSLQKLSQLKEKATTSHQHDQKQIVERRAAQSIGLMGFGDVSQVPYNSLLLHYQFENLPRDFRFGGGQVTQQEVFKLLETSIVCQIDPMLKEKLKEKILRMQKKKIVATPPASLMNDDDDEQRNENRSDEAEVDFDTFCSVMLSLAKV